MNALNPAMQMAQNYLEFTNTTIFLTGKAGTGKTTFLQNLRKTSSKKMAVVAPTGVAAINAGGMTIHSFFQLSFAPVIPTGNGRPELHYSLEKKELLNSLELLIIDEISMVRPDVLDQIDLILRNIKGSSHPFGGVQLLLIGDLSQLSPIIRNEEWAMLGRYYESPYFYSSLVMQKASYVRIELDHVYRQKEQAFVDILNEVRNQTISQTSLDLLNARYVPNFKPDAAEPYITLTTHNGIAQQINNEFLTALPGTEIEFGATIRGDFPKDAYPTDTSLKLKIGAQVMFVKNDASAEKLFYNGKIGTVTRVENDAVFVQCGQQDKEIMVEAVEWTNIAYTLESDTINETNTGSFAQIPLKLAWSITIHKSQGLSFDKAVIDVSESFAHGQAYVALSRCRSLAGMVLRNPIATRNIIGDPAVARYNVQAMALKPDEKRLERDRQQYELYLLSELFNFNPLQAKLGEFEPLLPNAQQDIFSIADKFKGKLKTDRSMAAAGYFQEKLTAAVESLHQQLPAQIGKAKDKAAKADHLMNWLMDRIRLMAYFAVNAFSTDSYLEVSRQKAKASGQSYLKTLNDKPNQKLFEQLQAWREEEGAREKMMPNMVLTEQTLAAIAEKLPETLKALSAIKGVGPLKTQLYGARLITMIRAYSLELLGAPADQRSLF
ncbi:HRDC domain-containing protein [Mucilaginibacter galii]|uniref:Helicase n=1 Tax=Mucilaginibacter galii TaxID=2005073 RepID=A0A917N1L2_9SPHI|nr:HRDC domain-containing protein [Mucilaginibacter galii]GGI49147.1 helicase [Mucilaginibacter galii]